MINPCKVCGTVHSEDGGPQVFSHNQVFDLACPQDDFCNIEYSIRCLNCGCEVYDEYLDDLVGMWNG